MNFTTTGMYTISSDSTINTFGCIYNNSFDILYPNSSLSEWNDDGGGNQQFKMMLNINATYNYILVVTTYGQIVVGSFSVTAHGPGEVVFSQLTASGMPLMYVTFSFSIHTYYVGSSKSSTDNL